MRPFGFDGKQTVSRSGQRPGEEVANFWGDLVTSGVASNDPDFNDAWYQGLNNGKYATLPIAAWGPVFLQGAAARRRGSGGPRPAAVGCEQGRSRATGVARPTR